MACRGPCRGPEATPHPRAVSSSSNLHLAVWVDISRIKRSRVPVRESAWSNSSRLASLRVWGLEAGSKVMG